MCCWGLNEVNNFTLSVGTPLDVPLRCPHAAVAGQLLDVAETSPNARNNPGGFRDESSSPRVGATPLKAQLAVQLRERILLNPSLEGSTLRNWNSLFDAINVLHDDAL